MNAPAETHGCGRTIDRRAFLVDAGLIAMAVLSQLGVASGMQAQPLPSVTGTISATGGLSYAIPAEDGATADAVHKVLLVRAHGTLYAFSLACPHRGALLEWQSGASRAYCPKHKARFQSDGTNDGGRQTRSLDRYTLRLEANRVVVDTTTQLRADAEPAAWAAAQIRLAS